MHRLLKRQVKKSLGISKKDEISEETKNFLNLVEKTYESFDIEKSLLENTISINTEELSELNRQIEIDGELRLKGLIEQAPYGFIIINSKGIIIDVNQFACRILGYDKPDFMKLTAFDLFKNNSKHSFENIQEETVKDIELSFDYNFPNCFDTHIPIEVTAGKLIIKDVPHVLIMFQDIIERVQAERIAVQKQKEIEELNKNLEKRVKEEVLKNLEKDQLLVQQSKMAAMGDMMGNIAHQWRQPLNTLAISVQDVEEAYMFDDLDEEYLRKFIDSSMANIKFMSKTIDDFRNFFQPSKKKENFKLRDSINDILNIVSAQLENNKIKISVTGDNFEVIGYPNEFKQVILNLTNNSKDAILENKIESGNISIAIESYSNEFKKVSIKDNGGGVPQKIIDKVFEPYFTTKEGNKGTGIGLYMSKTIIEENMKGKLMLENVGNGALFSILVPFNI